MLKKITVKIRFFFDVLVKSLTKLNYYKEIAKARFKFSLRYLFFLYFLISLVSSLVFAASISALILPKVPAFISGFKSKAISLYPEGLVVSIQNGAVTTNEKEPFYIDSLNQFKLNGSYNHFLTIDTNADPSDIKNLNTSTLLTKDAFVTVDSNNTYKVYPLDPKSNLTINKNSYSKLISQITPYLSYIQPILIALVLLAVLVWPFIGGGLGLGGELLYLLLFTLVLLLVSKLMKKNLHYKKLYQLAMHAATLPIILGFIVASVGIHMPFLLGSAILLIFMVLVLNQF